MTAAVKPQKVNLRDLVRDEYSKCASDPRYFMRRYCYIQHKIRGRMLFDLYPFQDETIQTLRDKDRVIILKARQIGISTVVACYSLWVTLFHSDKTVLVIATKQETAKNLIAKAQFAYEHLPVWLRSPYKENNKLNLKFKNGSEIKAVSSSGDAGRSEAVSLLIIDEAAHIDRAEEIWISAQSTLATGGRSIIISTPFGVGNFFHSTWTQSENKENDFARVKLNWRVHPDRDDEWYQKEYALLGDRGFRQEYEAEFLGSGNTVYETTDIMFYKETYKMDPIEKRGFDGNLWIWEQPNYTKPYLLVADVARGDGLDSSTFHVLEGNTCTQVAEYKGKLDTTDFGHMLIEVGTFYNDALIVVENATQGWAVLQVIINRGYKNLFYMSEDPLVVEQGRLLTNKWTQYDRKKVPGFTTSNKTRPLIISKLDEYLRSKTVIIHSDRLLNEMLTFIWENGKAVAQEGYNDDLIMAMAIGLWVRDTSLKLYQQNIDLMKLSVDGIKREGVDNTPVITTLPSYLTYDPFIMPMGPGRNNPYAADSDPDSDLRWLLR